MIMVLHADSVLNLASSLSVNHVITYINSPPHVFRPLLQGEQYTTIRSTEPRLRNFHGFIRASFYIWTPQLTLQVYCPTRKLCFVTEPKVLLLRFTKLVHDMSLHYSTYGDASTRSSPIVPEKSPLRWFFLSNASGSNVVL